MMENVHVGIMTCDDEHYDSEMDGDESEDDKAYDVNMEEDQSDPDDIATEEEAIRYEKLFEQHEIMVDQAGTASSLEDDLVHIDNLPTPSCSGRGRGQNKGGGRGGGARGGAQVLG